MSKLNNYQQHSACMLGSGLHGRAAWVPRCFRRVPQGKLQWGRWKGRQVTFVIIGQQNKVMVGKYSKRCVQLQDSGKWPEKPWRVPSWIWVGPKLGERESNDGESCLWCFQTNWMPTASLMLSNAVEFDAVRERRKSYVATLVLTTLFL